MPPRPSLSPPDLRLGNDFTFHLVSVGNGDSPAEEIAIGKALSERGEGNPLHHTTRNPKPEFPSPLPPSLTTYVRTYEYCRNNSIFDIFVHRSARVGNRSRLTKTPTPRSAEERTNSHTRQRRRQKVQISSNFVCLHIKHYRYNKCHHLVPPVRITNMIPVQPTVFGSSSRSTVVLRLQVQHPEGNKHTS